MSSPHPLSWLGGGEERALYRHTEKWSAVYANASKAIHPPYMEISLVPDTYNATACLMVEFRIQAIGQTLYSELDRVDVHNA